MLLHFLLKLLRWCHELRGRRLSLDCRRGRDLRTCRLLARLIPRRLPHLRLKRPVLDVLVRSQVDRFDLVNLFQEVGDILAVERRSLILLRQNLRALGPLLGLVDGELGPDFDLDPRLFGGQYVIDRHTCGLRLKELAAGLDKVVARALQRVRIRLDLREENR